MVITRFAPSPTGHLHIGGLRTALYSFLHARAKGGKFLLRIEDTDRERNSKEALFGILEAFKWVGLNYEEPMLFQSERTAIYQEYAKKLLESNHAYYCYLTKEELMDMRTNNKGANHANCSRKYRDFKGEIPKDVTPCIRIKAPMDGTISFNDGIKGEISFQASELDDFVILRSDGTPTYNFVVAIDDALSGMTDIIRGDDHISNTPKQLLVYKALGFNIPRFYHIPMICNEQGKKLSKRDGALSVLEYRDNGILPEALLNFLFKLGYGHGDKEIFSMQEMIECFEPHRINSNPSGCNFSKLYWLNAEYIKAMDNDILAKLLDMPLLDSISLDKRNILLDELKTRVNELVSMRNCITQILHAPLTNKDTINTKNENTKEGDTKDVNIKDSNAKYAYYDHALYNKLFTQETKEYLITSLNQFIDKLQEKEYELSNKDSIKTLIQEYASSLTIKPAIFMQTLRLALLGQKGGIDLGACLYILGKNESIERIKTLIAFAG